MKICLGQNKKLWAAIKQSKEQQQRSRWGMGTNTWSYGSPGQQGFGISELGSSSSRSSSYKMDRGTLLSAKQPLLWSLFCVLKATERTLGPGGDSRAGEAAQGSHQALLAAHESRSIPGTELGWHPERRAAPGSGRAGAGQAPAQGCEGRDSHSQSRKVQLSCGHCNLHVEMWIGAIPSSVTEAADELTQLPQHCHLPKRINSSFWRYF